LLVHVEVQDLHLFVYQVFQPLQQIKCIIQYKFIKSVKELTDLIEIIFN
jgi:hypothetical protein